MNTSELLFDINHLAQRDIKNIALDGGIIFKHGSYLDGARCKNFVNYHLEEGSTEYIKVFNVGFYFFDACALLMPKYLFDSRERLITTLLLQLSNKIRFSGNGFNVLAHTRLMQLIAMQTKRNEACASILLHDLHEAIVTDVPSPVKKYATGISEIEYEIDKLFSWWFRLPLKTNETAKIDYEALCLEYEYLNMYYQGTPVNKIQKQLVKQFKVPIAIPNLMTLLFNIDEENAWRNYLIPAMLKDSLFQMK